MNGNMFSPKANPVKSKKLEIYDVFEDICKFVEDLDGIVEDVKKEITTDLEIYIENEYNKDYNIGKSMKRLADEYIRCHYMWYISDYKLSKDHNRIKVKLKFNDITKYAILRRYDLINSSSDPLSYLKRGINEDILCNNGNYLTSVKRFIALLYLTNESINTFQTRLLGKNINRLELIANPDCMLNKKEEYFNQLVGQLLDNIQDTYKLTDMSIRYLPKMGLTMRYGDTTFEDNDCVIFDVL